MEGNNKPILVSVIVPVYNVEKYLDECINSICLQTYFNIEIIIIDDGSIDDSGKKCDEWAKKDKRIQVIHKQNGGLSDARNCGLELAKGEWFLFLDSDDYIEYGLVEKCLETVNRLSDAEIDIVFFGYTEFVDNCKINQIDEIKTPPLIKNSEDIIREIIFGTQPVMVCTKLYKKRIWDNIRFPIGRIHEDDFVIMPTLKVARKICIMLEKMYFYRRRPDGLSRTMNEKEIRDKLEAYKERLDYIKDDEELLEQAVYQYLCTLMIVYFQQSLENRKLYINEYREEYRINKKVIRKLKRIPLEIFRISPVLYKLIINFRKGYYKIKGRI